MDHAVFLSALTWTATISMSSKLVHSLQWLPSATSKAKERILNLQG